MAADGTGDGSVPRTDETESTVGDDATWLDRLRAVGVVRGVLAITVLALAIRLLLLGQRTLHWDEARVAYWILHTIETGDFAYRRIIHGPVVQHVHHVLVPLLGNSDFVMRLPVALVGALLPATALLFREHLEDDEVTILALFLGFNAVLLYYSRFMRSDVLVAVFMFAAFGGLVRFYDTRRPGYVYAVAALIALGFGAKENALLYVMTWVGAAVLLADRGLHRPWDYDRGSSLLRAKLRNLRAWRPTNGSRASAAGRWSVHLLGALVVFLALTVFIYGPRGAGMAGIYYPPPGATDATLGFWEAVGQPTSMPGYVVSTLTDTGWQYMEWISQGSDAGCNKDNLVDGYLCYLGRYVRVMASHAGVLTAFAVGGFLLERYGRSRSRNLVMFAAYGGFASVVGYPFATDVFGSWLVVHALVPLAIPAAVCGAWLFRRATAETSLQSLADQDRQRQLRVTASLLTAVVLVVAVVGGGFLAVSANYGEGSWTEEHMVQYAQPGDDLGPVVDAIETSVADGGGEPDVLVYYGATGDQRNDDIALVRGNPEWSEGDLLTRPPCVGFFNGLPPTYYYAAANATVDCASDRVELARESGADGAGVIIALEADQTVPVEDLQVEGYEHDTYELRQNDRVAHVFVHERLDVE